MFTRNYDSKDDSLHEIQKSIFYKKNIFIIKFMNHTQSMSSETEVLIAPCSLGLTYDLYYNLY